MQKYADVLEKVAGKEWSSVILLIVVLCVFVAAAWISNHLRFRRMKKKHPAMYESKKQVKMRRQAFWALLAVSFIGVGVGAFACWDTARTVADIQKDIAEKDYITYTGAYYVSDSDYSRRQLYDRWVSVDLENDEYAFIYMNSWFEWIATGEGDFEGTVVYGKNSRIVVDMTNDA